MASNIEDFDYLIVGSGLVGSVIAHELATRKNKKVLVWERRNHIAGNLFDYMDEYGIRVHKYGPHVFHTNKKELFTYITNFGKFSPFKIKCLVEMEGKLTPSPFNFQTIDDFYSPEEASLLKNKIRKFFQNREFAPVAEVMNHHDPVIRQYGEFLFEKDYAPYTAKQWGVSPKDIHPSVLARVPIRFSYETGYFDDHYQALPTNGYTGVICNLLDHKNIQVELQIEALSKLIFSDDGRKITLRGRKKTLEVIYTGAVDELFAWKYGPLPYRSLSFEFIHENKESFQDAPLVAYPQRPSYTRITEYSKLPVQRGKGTTYAIEYPKIYNKNLGSEPYYPILTKESLELYGRYLKEAQKIENLFIAGRLADFKYYNMDQALERALQAADEIIAR